MRGVVLPDDVERDLWVDSSGLISDEPVPDAQTVARRCVRRPGTGRRALPRRARRARRRRRARAGAQIIADRDAGALLIRDAGVPVDTRWIDDRDDLPRVIRAGRHIARTKRYIRNYGVEIEPADLVAAVEAQAARGDGWVKLVGDWIDRDAGDLTTVLAGRRRGGCDRASPRARRAGDRSLLRRAVGRRARRGRHRLHRARHGTDRRRHRGDGRARGTALVPTRVQIDNFPTYADAGAARFPGYAAHMRDLHARADATLRSAHEAGVAIYAGTDAGGVLPHGLIGREVLALHAQVGLSPEAALGAASWRARDWLGRPGSGRRGSRPTSSSTTRTRGPTCARCWRRARSSCAAPSSPDPRPDLWTLGTRHAARRCVGVHNGAALDSARPRMSGMMARCTRRAAAPSLGSRAPRPPAGPDRNPTRVGTATRMRQAGASTTVAVKIKLKRMGKIRAPYYRIVVADARTKRDGRAIEEIGKYHPTEDPSLIEVDSERAQYWLGVGAQPTEPVAAILKVTGDWQKFKGLPGAEGTLRVAEPKADKKTVFEAAAKESAGEPKAGATTPRKKARRQEGRRPSR